MKKISFDVEKVRPIITKSSKGDQPKWFYKNQWYKRDSLGYEGLSEVVISRLLDRKNINNILKYYPINILYNGKESAGCYSENFIDEKEELITLERFHLSYTGIGLGEKLEQIKTTEERIKYTVDFIEKNTGLTYFHEWMTSIIEIDSKFLNEDRHTNNLAVIRNFETKEYRLSPIFDNGLALVSDLNEYPMNISTKIHMRNVKAKPFSTDFSKQLKACHNLYGKILDLEIDKKDIDNSLIGMEEYYPEEILNRVRMVLKSR